MEIFKKIFGQKLKKNKLNNNELNKIYYDESVNLLQYCFDNKTEEALSILNNNKNIEYLNYKYNDIGEHRTAFIWACVNKMSGVIDRLIDISILIYRIYKRKRVNDIPYFNINQKDIYGKTALMYLCDEKNNLYEQFKKLIDNYLNKYSENYDFEYDNLNKNYYLDLNIKDNEGNTALIIALKNNNSIFFKKILELIELRNLLREKKRLPIRYEIKQLNIIYEMVKNKDPSFLEEIKNKIISGIHELSYKQFKTLYQITEKHVPNFLPELYKKRKFMQNRMYLHGITSDVFGNSNSSKQKLANKIEEILLRIESHKLNGIIKLNENEKGIIKLNENEKEIIKVIYNILRYETYKDLYLEFKEYFEQKYPSIIADYEKEKAEYRPPYNIQMEERRLKANKNWEKIYKILGVR